MDPTNFTKTSFCNVEIDNITTNESKEYILNQMSILCSDIKYNSRYAKVYNEQYSKAGFYLFGVPLMFIVGELIMLNNIDKSDEFQLILILNNILKMN